MLSSKQNGYGKSSYSVVMCSGAQDLLCNLAVVLLLQTWPTSLDLQRAYAFLKRLSWSSHMEIHGHHVLLFLCCFELPPPLVRPDPNIIKHLRPFLGF